MDWACSRTVRELIRELTDCANDSVVRGELANTCSRTVHELFATVRKLIREQISETQTPDVTRPCGKLIGVDANFVELRCPQYKGSINCPRRVSLNTVSARMEELIGHL